MFIQETTPGVDIYMKEGLYAESVRGVNGYGDDFEHFTSKVNRDRLIEVNDRLTKYLYDKDVKNFVLFDRGARPAYFGVTKTWDVLFSSMPKPEIYFINPRGFVRRDFFGKDTGKTEEEIRSDFEHNFKRLCRRKELPTMLFDICIHTGDSMKSVLSFLHSYGFEDLRVGVAGNHGNFSDIKLDFVGESEKTSLLSCNPFSRDSFLERQSRSVMSCKKNDKREYYSPNKLRKEIGLIVKANCSS